MADENEEKVEGTAEQEKPLETEVKPASDVVEPASDEEKATTGEEVKKGEEGTETEPVKTVPFTETEEFKRAVQSAADKATATARLNALKETQLAKAETDRIKREADEDKEREQWRGRQAAEKQAWVNNGISEEAVNAFQLRESQLIDAERLRKRREADYTPKIERVDRMEAAETAIKDVLGEDALERLTLAEYRAVINAAEGDTLRERIAYAKLKALEFKKASVTTAKAQSQTRNKPDSVKGSTGGGGIPTEMGAFRRWVGELSQTEYEKLAPRIKELLDNGKIK